MKSIYLAYTLLLPHNHTEHHLTGPFETFQQCHQQVEKLRKHYGRAQSWIAHCERKEDLGRIYQSMPLDPLFP